MADVEKIVEDVETEEQGFVEAYIRFNDDSEKDYCFQVNVNTHYNDLFKIFNTLPISLRPSLFYSQKPVGFKVSVAPGYLTEDGALLFDNNATDAKYLKSVDLHDKIGDTIWPGQLIVPVWHFYDFGFYMFVSALLVWLYTDLPNFISPTPGICLTTQMTKALSWGLENILDKPDLAKDFVDDINSDMGIAPQLVFFVFHILKVVMIFLVVQLGLFNPIKLFKFMGPPVKKDITKEELLELGWTGSKRATVDEYKEYYRNFKIKQYKTVVEAHQAGIFDKLKYLGCPLGNGEGFNTPLDHKSTIADLMDEENIKFTLNYAYLARLSLLFEKHINSPDVDVHEAVKQFRRYGLLQRDETIEKIVELRKTLEVAKFKATTD